MTSQQRLQCFNKILQNLENKGFIAMRLPYPLSLYTVTHLFILTLIANKGKCKGKKISQKIYQSVATCCC